MKVVLKEDIFKLGSLGDEVEVKRGYARNYLIPQGKALLLTRANIKQIAHQKKLLTEKRAEAIANWEFIRKKLEDAKLVFLMKASESGKLFGSVTQKNIYEALLKQDIEVDRKKINLPAPVKALGNHVILVKLHTEVTAELKVQILNEMAKEKAPDAPEIPEPGKKEKASDENQLSEKAS